MNGPKPFEGDQKMKRENLVPKWTEDEAAIGKAFLEISRQYNGTFLEKRDAVTCALSGKHCIYSKYTDLPAGVRSFISTDAAKRKGVKNTARWNARLVNNVRKATEEWDATFANASPPKQVSMIHPDDQERYLV